MSNPEVVFEVSEDELDGGHLGKRAELTEFTRRRTVLMRSAAMSGNHQLLLRRDRGCDSTPPR